MLIPFRHVAPSALKLICMVNDPGAMPLAITFHAFSVKIRIRLMSPRSGR